RTPAKKLTFNKRPIPAAPKTTVGEIGKDSFKIRLIQRRRRCQPRRRIRHGSIPFLIIPTAPDAQSLAVTFIAARCFPHSKAFTFSATTLDRAAEPREYLL